MRTSPQAPDDADDAADAGAGPRPSAAPSPAADHAAGARPRVLACGLATLDVTQVVDALPGPDEKIVARDQSVTAGGPALNAVISAAHLGCAATLVTRVGSGGAASAVHAELAREGVDVVDLADAGWALAVSTVLVTRATGARAVVSTNAAALDSALDAALGAHAPHAPALPSGLLDGVSAVLVDGHHLDLAVAVARSAQAAGVPVLLDGGSWKPGTAALLEHVDVAVLSADFRVPPELRAPGDAPGEDADELAVVHALGPRVVARSHGAGPVRVAAWPPHEPGTAPPGRPWQAPAWEGTVTPDAVDDVRDTLGAGDVLHGALLAGLGYAPVLAPGGGGADDAGAARRSRTLAWVEAAARVATASVQHVGARGWTQVPGLADALRVGLSGPDRRLRQLRSR